MPNLIPKMSFGSSAEGRYNRRRWRGGRIGSYSVYASASARPVFYVSNLIYGAALIAVGMHVKADGIGYFLIGAGVVFAIDGLVRIAIPALRAITAPAFTQLKQPSKNPYSAMTSLNI